MTIHLLWALVRLLALVVFINRYIAGVFLRLIRGEKMDVADASLEPTVTAVIPMYNEGATIAETIRSLLDSHYPHGKLSVVVVDDCSTDNSYEHARDAARLSNGRCKVLRNPRNLGKRRSIIRAVREAKSEIIVSVDSDVVVDADAVRQLVRRFTSPRIAAVGGWIDVRNKQDNWLTRMQVVRYWYAYHFMKNLEWSMRRVLCLSGCLTAYRRSVLIDLEPILEHRAILGVPIKYGEDRFLTRQIVKAGYLTTMTLTARCYTTVPSTLSGYFSQQLRWRRSNTIDYAGGFTHVWRLNPIIAIHYFSLFALQFAYPLALLRALGTHRFFEAIWIHLMVIAIMGVVYRYRVRNMPKAERVSAAAFLPLAILMPVAYALLAPLALFTLDSGSWETRSYQELAPAAELPAREVRDLPAPQVGEAQQLPAA